MSDNLIPVNTMGYYDEETQKWIPVDAIAVKSNSNRYTADDIKAKLDELYRDVTSVTKTIGDLNKLRGEDSTLVDKIINEFSLRSVDVTKFGCVDDGITDNTPMIKEASKKGDLLYFPKITTGVYLISEFPEKKSHGLGSSLKFINPDYDENINDNKGKYYYIDLDDKALEVNSIWQKYIQLNNTDLGVNAGKKLTPQSYGNVAVGNNALKDAEENVKKNVAIGHNAINQGTSLYHNVAIGTDAARDMVTAQRNTIVGGNAGISIGDTIVVGRNPMFRNDVDNSHLDKKWPNWRQYVGEVNSPKFIAKTQLDARGNTAIGRNALGWSVTPEYCTALGYNALEKAIDGSGSVAIGVNASYHTIKSSNSVVAGLYANMNNSSSEGDISLGASSMRDVPHSRFNVAIGYQSMQRPDSPRDNEAPSKDNIAIGRFAQANGTKTILSNVAVGASALRYNDGNYNTSVGQQSLQDNTTGEYNTALGVNAGRQIKNANYVTALGYNALNSNAYDNFTNITGVGQNSSVTGSNQLQLGNSAVTPTAFAPLQVRSDERDKIDIEDTELGLNFIKKLKPVQYRWNYREAYEEKNIKNDGSLAGVRKHQGLIAQQVKQVMDELNVDFAGYQDHSINGGKDVKSIAYEELFAPIIKSIQELSNRIEMLEKNT
ncbi:hypothetical protein BN2127_JRS7_02838 [Bacillus subtilis]|nr:hypothetical protein BN2127_JRS1_06944 [Bacillus cereus]CUB42198.1 hypothetical protein BN2127_JRS7_02838 [Bacillus subtilis]